jgi:hypothetical protein
MRWMCGLFLIFCSFVMYHSPPKMPPDNSVISPDVQILCVVLFLIGGYACMCIGRKD